MAMSSNDAFATGGGRRGRRRGRRGKGALSEINVTPLVDVMLVLLIIFMITTPMLQEGIYVTLARAQNPQVASGMMDKETITIALTRDQKVYFNQEDVTLAQLEKRLAEVVAKEPGKPVFVKGDVAVRYGTIVQVMNMARDAGMERVGLLVEHETNTRVPSMLPRPPS